LRVSLIEPGVIATPIWQTSAKAADRMLAEASPKLLEYYGVALDAVRRRVLNAVRGAPPERVAEVVSHALTARRPHVRYLVGRDARLRILMRTLLPAGVRDRLIARALARL
jgi:NAD(P)-dependent dehydrogenase (short-subunit alcohol dehydrogenase family)